MSNPGNLTAIRVRGISRVFFAIVAWLAAPAGVWLVPSESAGTLVAEIIAESNMGDGELATAVPIESVHALAAGSGGEIYLIDGQGWLREIGTNGRIRTVRRGPVTSVAVDAERGSVYATGEGVRVVRTASQGATRSSVDSPRTIADATDIAVAANGAVYVLDSTQQPKQLMPSTGELLALANMQSASQALPDDPGSPRIDMIAAGADGTLYAASRSSTRVRTLSLATPPGALPPVPSVASGIGGIAVGRDGFLYANAGGVWRYEKDGWRQLTEPTAEFAGPLAVQDDGIILFDRVEQRVVRFRPDGTRQVLGGSGRRGSIGDGGPANKASFLCAAVTVDATGNILFSDSLNSRVAAIDKSGRIDTYIGSARHDVNGVLSDPLGLDVAADGTVYVADPDQHRVYMRTSEGRVAVFAGNGEEGFGGDGGPARAAMLRFPSDVRSDSSGGLYILDSQNMRVRHVDQDGVIRTVALIDPGPKHEWEWPSKLLATSSGEIFVTSVEPPAVLKLDSAATARRTQVAAQLVPLNPSPSEVSEVSVVEMVGSAFLISDTPENAKGIFPADLKTRHRIDRPELLGDLRGNAIVGDVDNVGNIIVCDKDRIVRLREDPTQ